MSNNEQQNDRKQLVETERRIRKKFNVYMSETSQYNPFGANSITSPWQDKVVFKYNIMKEYIKLTKRDALAKEYEQSRYIGVIILGLVGGYFGALALTSLIQRGRNLKTNTPALWDPLLYGICMTSGFGYCYISAQQRYNKNVCWFILNKYLPQAVHNGFDDYEISK